MTQTARKQAPKELKETPRQMANRHLAAADYDRAQAANNLLQELNKSPTLRKAFLEQTINELIWNMERQAAHEFRQRCVASLDKAREDDPSGLLSAGKSNVSLYNWALPNGTRLGDATKADLDEAIELHEQQRQAADRKIQFYEAIKAKVKGNKTVKDSLSEKALEALW